MSPEPDVGPELRGLIQNSLGDPGFDVAYGLSTGAVKISTGNAPTGYTTLCASGDGQMVHVNALVKYTYLGYQIERGIIERECAAGRRNFPHIVGQIHRYLTDGLFSARKVATMGSAQLYGRTLVPQPFMGQALPIRREICVPFTDLIINEFLAEHLHPDVDAVFEMGSGPGVNLVQLAARNPYPKIEFFGGEIALNGHWCLRELAALAGVPSVHSVSFNMMNPDFSFLRGKRRVLIYSHFALMYATPFPGDFFFKLWAAAENIDLVLFEPVSFEILQGQEAKPMFPLSRAQNYGICTNLWTHIQSEVTAKRFVIDELIPDAFGKSALNAVTLIRAHKV
jgi:hypothetical protein